MAQRIDIPGMGIVEFPDGMSDDQISAAIRANMQPQQTDQVDPGIDVIKSAGTGVAKGALGVLGAPGDIGSLVSAGVDAAGRGLGLIDQQTLSGLVTGQQPDDSRWQGYKNTAKAVLASSNLTRPFVTAFSGPGSKELQGAVEKYTGEFYKPQTTAGKYAHTVGEFAPGALIPASRLGRIANVVAPGVASEAAGQATEGTAAEPYARFGAALLGGAGASRIGRVNASTTQRAAGTADERIAEVQQAAERGYQSPTIAAVEFRPGVVDALVTTTTRQLDRARFNDRLAPQTRGVLDDLRTPVNGAAHTVEDLQTARQQLSTIAGNFANPTEQAAASRAIQNITNYIERMPQSHLARGNAAEATQAWNTARSNYAAAKTAEKVQGKLYAGDLQAGSANSGANVGNASRQRLRTLLTNPKQGRGLTEAEGGLIEQTVQGSRMANALRTGGNLLGGGGGLGALISGGAGAAALGPIGVAAPVIGRILKSAGDAVTRRQANRIVDAILERAPETANIQRRGHQVLTDRQRRALIAQLSLAPLPAIRQPTQQPGY